MQQEPREPREFSDFSSGQDGWGNSILDEPRYRIPEDDEPEQDPDYPNEGETQVIVNNGDGTMECSNDNSNE